MGVYNSMKGWKLIFAAVAVMLAVVATKSGHSYLIPLFFMPLIGGV